jgi:hypothetical protein
VHDFVTALGWTGAVTCIVAYALVTRGTWAPTSRRFQLANIVGALLLTSVAARSHVWPSVASNVVWAAIGIQAMAMVARTRRSTAGTCAEPGLSSTPESRDEPVRRQGEVSLVA